MDNLVLSNIFFRKTRTFISMIGVAVGVVLVVMTVGLVNGFLTEQGRRNSAVTAEIMFHAPGSDPLSVATTLAIPISQADEIRSIEGVTEVVPVGTILDGPRVVDGIDYEAFTNVSGARVVEGRAVESGMEVMIDRVLEKSRKVKLGDKIEIFNQQFTIVGVYEPESLGRVKIPLTTMQQLQNREGLSSMLLVKIADPSQVDQIAARITEKFPKNEIRLTRDLPALYARGTPALQTFLKVVVGLAIVVSTLVILLVMYTTVLERTRQIGVLKSLGASKGWIAGEIEKEALTISLAGVVFGLLLSVAGKFAVQQFAGITVQLQLIWMIYALLIGIASGALGALYPALRAANQDPVKALSYE